MARYIDIEGIGIKKSNREQFLVPEFADGWNAVLKILDEEPTADVVEVKRGHWIWTEVGEEDYEQYWICSVCGEKSYIETKFCSDCGAKMDGGKVGGCEAFKNKADVVEIDDNLEIVIVSAVRYAIGRRTYVPSIVIGFTIPLLNKLSVSTLLLLERDICDADSYGDEKIDKPDWMMFLRKIREEKEGRII